MRARLAMAAGAAGLLVLGSASVSGAGLVSRDLVVVPTEVAYDELFEVSGEGCFTAVAFRMPEVPLSSRQVTAEPDGTWSVVTSVPSGAGIPPGPKTIEADCLGASVGAGASAPSQEAPGFSYNDATVTVLADEPVTTSTTAAPTTTADARAGTASPVAAMPAFTG